MRSCDGCTECCNLMHVRELGKGADEWCGHCDVGAGCRIYAARPQSCRDFECVWLQTQAGRNPLAPELRPDVSHVVISTTHGGETIVLNVGADRPDAWKQGATGALVRRMLADGIAVVLKCGDRIRNVDAGSIG